MTKSINSKHIDKASSCVFYGGCVLYVFIVLLVWMPALSQDKVTTLANTDHRHAWLSWAQSSRGIEPWGDPALFDPETNIPRLPLVVPNLLLSVLRYFLDPRIVWLVATVVGWISFALVLNWLFRLCGLSNSASLIGSSTIFWVSGILSNLPPFSLNQVRYILDYLTFSLPFEDKQPPFYGASVEYISVPFFFFTLCMTLVIFDDIDKGIKANHHALKKLVWTSCLLLLPLVYFYHWVQLSVILLLLTLLCVGNTTKRISYVINFICKYLLPVFVGWGIYLGVQIALTSSPTGYDYLLTTGFQEARFLLFEPGAIVRIIVITIVCLLFIPNILKHNRPIQAILLALIFSQFEMNLQILIGRTIQPGHFGFLNGELMSILVIILSNILWRYLIHSTRTAMSVLRIVFRILFLVAFGGVLLNGVIGTFLAWRETSEESSLSTAEQELIEFLNDNPQYMVFLINDIEIESNILFLLSRRSYLPWGALSTIQPRERMERAVIGWKLLSLSRAEESFGKWLRDHSWHLYHMKYGTSAEYSSTLNFIPKSRPQIILFRETGTLPDEERTLFAELGHTVEVRFRLDIVIYRRGDDLSPCLRESGELFKNSVFIVYAAPRYCS